MGIRRDWENPKKLFGGLVKFPVITYPLESAGGQKGEHVRNREENEIEEDPVGFHLFPFVA